MNILFPPRSTGSSYLLLSIRREREMKIKHAVLLGTITLALTLNAGVAQSGNDAANSKSNIQISGFGSFNVKDRKQRKIGKTANSRPLIVIADDVE